jgi:hypothetical protein
MRNLLSVFVLTALAPLTASAQETPKAELFIGYSYLHLDDGMSKKLGFLFPTGGSANGWNVSIDGNVNRWLWPGCGLQRSLWCDQEYRLQSALISIRAKGLLQA